VVTDIPEGADPNVDLLQSLDGPEQVAWNERRGTSGVERAAGRNEQCATCSSLAHETSWDG
jgi:hypothetical protein